MTSAGAQVRASANIKITPRIAPLTHQFYAHRWTPELFASDGSRGLEQ
jgi:hypothetical protein